VNKDEKLLLEAFTLLYTVYKDQHGGRKYYRPVSIYPTLSKIQNRLEKTIRQESLSIAKLRAEANSPWT
jgi:sugar-specific transcriptional regulator TrmB